jgi:phospholipid transport system substrate-binding protein
MNPLSQSSRGFFAALIFFISMGLAGAQSTGNLDVEQRRLSLQQSVDEVLALLRTRASDYEKNPQSLRTAVAAVAAVVLQQFHTRRMAQLALASHWKKLTDAQRDLYVDSFKHYAIDRYMGILYLYRNSKPRLQGDGVSTGASANQWRFRIKNAQGDWVSVYFHLQQIDAASKIIDVNVDGVSMVILARADFAQRIEQLGLEKFLDQLAQQ